MRDNGQSHSLFGDGLGFIAAFQNVLRFLYPILA